MSFGDPQLVYVGFHGEGTQKLQREKQVNFSGDLCNARCQRLQQAAGFTLPAPLQRTSQDSDRGQREANWRASYDSDS